MKFIKLLTLLFLLPSFGEVGVGLHAQDLQLFEHTWYFANGEFEGEGFQPINNLNGALDFFSNILAITHSFCEEGGEGNVVDYQNNIFVIEDFFAILIGVCNSPEELEFMHNHYSIYGDYNDTGIANNPFTYEIVSVNDYYQLTIENGEGDWAVYNSVLLSTPSFDESRFVFYPNPVKETLHINNGSKQQVAVTIYDVSGKVLQKHSFENSNEAVDVKTLNPGLYFVVFENESGERVSKKFIKK